MLAKKSIKIKENLNNDLYRGHCTCACAKLLQSCPTLCNPMDCDPPRSSVHGILQARILEWVALLSSRGSPDPGIQAVPLMSPALAGGFLTTSATWEALLWSLNSFNVFQKFLRCKNELYLSIYLYIYTHTHICT